MSEVRHWTLGSLLDGIIVVPQSMRSVSLKGLVDDSRKVEPGDLFVALAGSRQHGAHYIDEAIERGAAAILSEERRSLEGGKGENILVVEGVRHHLGAIASRYYGNPSRHLNIAAVTGTDGKSTVAWLVASALEQLEGNSAVVGTVENRMMSGRQLQGDVTHTTPPPIELQRLLHEVRGNQGQSVAMEASSHGIDQQRLNGCRIRSAILTQLGRDHLDYHGSLEAYKESKRKLFYRPELESVVLNLDDALGREISREPPPCRVIGYSMEEGSAPLHGEIVQQTRAGMVLRLHYEGEQAELHTALLGRFNGYNLLAVLGLLLSWGISLRSATAVLAACRPLPGRMEPFYPDRGEGSLVVVDYAHTGGALQAALEAARQHLQQGRLWVVFGCGGERDRGKRPEMGSVAERSADRLVVTSDNPRGERPADIIDEILAGITSKQSVDVIENRANAIHFAFQHAESADLILVAGKGHEQWQEIAGAKHPFSDRKVAEALIYPGLMHSLSQVAERLDGELNGEDLLFSGVGTDSRTLSPGELFVALKGPNFDGSDYLQMALERGATGAVVHQLQPVPIPQIVVDDTLKSLGALAAAWRRQFSIPVVGITGSNGKTTVKEMAASILRQLGPGTVTAGNLNNEIGVPLTLLQIRPEDHWAIIEMGANAVGEIRQLTEMAAPTIALANNAGTAHLGGFGSAEQIVEAKGEIYAALPENGVAVINRDLPQRQRWSERASGKMVVYFGYQPEGDGLSGIVEMGQPFQLAFRGEQVKVDLPLPGKHNRLNALAAAALSLQVGATLQQVQNGLEQVQGVPGRLQYHLGPQGCTIINDSYNASPESMRSAIDVLAAEPGVRILVVGDMAELGEEAPALHRDIGVYAASMGVDRLYAVGEHATAVCDGFSGGEWFETVDQLAVDLQFRLHDEMTILVKGSRFMKMERVVEQLCENRAM